MDKLEYYARRAIDFLLEQALEALRALICAERMEERERCIEVAARAMMDAGLDEDAIREQLQKQWDLRRSEALSVIGGIHGELALAVQVALQPEGQ